MIDVLLLLSRGIECYDFLLLVYKYANRYLEFRKEEKNLPQLPWHVMARIALYSSPETKYTLRKVHPLFQPMLRVIVEEQHNLTEDQALAATQTAVKAYNQHKTASEVSELLISHFESEYGGKWACTIGAFTVNEDDWTTASLIEQSKEEGPDSEAPDSAPEAWIRFYLGDDTIYLSKEHQPPIVIG